MEDKSKPNPLPLDVYDEEFFNGLKLAKAMIKEFHIKGDKLICKKWISKLVDLKSEDPVVKRNRNSFFKYLLSVMEKALKDGAFTIEGKKEKDDDHFMCKWSNDKRTYIAAKPIPGLGTLVYLAVSKNPALGWDHPNINVEST